MESEDYSVTPEELEALKIAGWVSQGSMEAYVDFLKVVIQEKKTTEWVFIFDPTLALFMSYEKDKRAAQEVLDSVGMKTHEIILIPLMTREYRKEFGGDVWSLLICSKKSQDVFSFSPCKLQNSNEQRVLDKIKKSLKLDQEAQPKTIEYKKAISSPSESGLFVILAMEAIISSLKETSHLNTEEKKETDQEKPDHEFLEIAWKIPPSAAIEKRNSLYQMIKGIKAK